jgi:predicted Zn-dependent protease with MMP-like domain
MPRPDADLDRWRTLSAPPIAQLEALAREAFEALPDPFRALCRDLVIQVEDFPSDEVLARMGLTDPFDLLGLFEGVGLPFQSATDSGRMPNMIWLYRRPILDYWAEHEETLGAIVSHVLVHEIGHHFGLSDADMEMIEAAVA